MNLASRSFAFRHKWDSALFRIYAGSAWLVALMGFGPQIHGHLTGHTPSPPLVIHLHAAAAVCWLALFTVQVGLIGAGKLTMHRKLGLGATVLIPVMFILGVAASIASRRVQFESGQFDMLAFMIVPLTDILQFTILAIAAVLLRTEPAVHKRLILLATLLLLRAAFGHWIEPWLSAYTGDGFIGLLVQAYLATDLTIMGAILYDRVTRGRIHPIYFIATPCILTMQATTSAIYHWSGWLPLVRQLIGH